MPVEQLAPTPEQLAFQQDVFFYIGIVYFGLFAYWATSLFKRFNETIGFAILMGLGFSVVACLEWGFNLIGTALPLGACIGLALVSPGASACLLVSSLFLRPWELVPNDPYLSLLPRLSLLLCVGHLALRHLAGQKISIDRSRLAVTILGFAAWCLVTTIAAPESANSLGEFFGSFIKSVVLYFVVVAMVNTREDFKRVVVTLLMSFLFVALVSMIQSETDTDIRLKGFGAFKNSNDIAALMVLILPFAFVTAARKIEGLGLRLLGGALSLAALAAVVLSRSRGAILAVAVIIGVYVVMRAGRRALVPVAVGMAVLAIPATMVLANRSAEDLQGSSSGRATYLKAGLQMGLRNPILGVGFNAYPVSLIQYTTDSLEEEKNMTAHNSWVLVFAEEGFLGLILFSIIFLLSGRAALRLYPVAPEFLLALAGYGFTMIFLSHSYLIYPFLLYGMIRSAENVRRIELT